VPGVDRGGNIPNLGYMDASYIENLPSFVFKGPAMARGMPDFTGKLSGDDVESIKAFIQGRRTPSGPSPEACTSPRRAATGAPEPRTGGPRSQTSSFDSIPRK
jgi:hypothetical protein